MNVLPKLEQYAWLYTRGDESVRMVIDEQGSGLRVRVYGPGSALATYEFDTMASLNTFVAEYQQQLLASQFQLQVQAERRLDRTDRRRTPRAPDRRRTREA